MGIVVITESKKHTHTSFQKSKHFKFNWFHSFTVIFSVTRDLVEQDVFFYKMLEILWFTTMKEQGEVRSKFMATAFQLHNRGLVHGNISSSPVRAPDGSIFFVGLGKMKEEECPCKNVKIEPGFAPSISEFPCKELRRLAITLNIWKPGMVCS
ncbi:hypothetical protein C8Q75DRAFT_27412 [Abortiporus biennis]|nr:hypothetical protein C8Q75DRAFT_27412 [Abortiporus biennis]